MTTLYRTLLATALGLALALPATGRAQSFDADLLKVQQEWAHINYEVAEKARSDAFESLEARAAALTNSHPDDARALTWQGIVLSSWAGARGGLGALKLVDRARELYERSIEIDAASLGGSALGSLGVLYHKVPGWPLSFGSDGKAEDFLKRALAVNPEGIDANYFYGEFLVDEGRAAEAIPYIEKALVAPARAQRPLADAGRRQEAQSLLQRARQAMAKS